jgi:hypothetical protein
LQHPSSSQESTPHPDRGEDGEDKDRQTSTPLVKRVSLRCKLDHPQVPRFWTHPIPIVIATTPAFFEVQT